MAAENSHGPRTFQEEVKKSVLETSGADDAGQVVPIRYALRQKLGTPPQYYKSNSKEDISSCIRGRVKSVRETKRRNAGKQAGKGDVHVGNNTGKSAKKHEPAQRKRKRVPSNFETAVQAPCTGGGSDANNIDDSAEHPAMLLPWKRRNYKGCTNQVQKG